MRFDPETCLAQIRARGDAGRAEEMARYHKSRRAFTGTPNPVLNDLTRGWRRALDLPARIELADALWRSDIHEARVAAAKLLTQARIRPDDGPAWVLIRSWVPDFDGWAIADHACTAAAKRLLADPARLDEVEGWTRSAHMWTRRAALVATLPWAKMPHPGAPDLARRDRILGWAAAYVPDRDWFIQKAIAWWLRDLSKHDPGRSRAFLARHGAAMKPFARREAGRYLPELADPTDGPDRPHRPHRPD